MKTYRTYTYRIYPNKEQKELIFLTFKMCREIFNTLTIIKYEILKKFRCYIEECLKKQINPNEKAFFRNEKEPSLASLKKVNENFKKVDSLALLSEEKNVMRAFIKYFNGDCNKPKLKKRKDKNTYATSNVNNNIRVDKNSIRLPKLGNVNAVVHRPLPDNSKIKKATIKEDKCGKFYACIIIEIETSKEEKTTIVNTIGLDFKIGDIFVSSEGNMPSYSNPYRNSLKVLRDFERSLSKKIKYSKGYFKCIDKIRRLHKIITFKRKDFLHKISRILVKKYNVVIIEDLSLIEISKKLKNGINTYDTSYYKFIEMINYKIEGIVIKINRWFPSSKMCSACKVLKKKLRLGQSLYRCNNCGLVINRDLNAAINIKNEGNRLLLEYM